MKVFFVLLCSVGLALALPSAWGTTVTVGTTADGTGINPLTLRAAIAQANNTAAANLPFIIMVPPGTYSLTSGELQIGPGVSSGPGNKISIIGTGNAGNTIIRQTDGHNRVFNLDPNSFGGSTFALANLTITGGHDANDGNGGGGILTGNLGNGSPDVLNLTNCVISTNSTTGDGAGLGAEGGSVTAVGCTFIKNSLAGGTTMAGAGAFFLPYNAGDTFTAINCLYLQNTITAVNSSQEVEGAGLTLDTDNIIGSQGHLTNCVFGGNSVSSSGSPANQDYGGGGLYVAAGSTVQVVGCTFTNNSAAATIGGISGNGGNGGAILAQENVTSLLVQYCRFFGNTAASGGASAIWGHSDGTSHITANDDWWASNTGPSAAATNRISTLANWLVLSNSAAGAIDALGAADSLTASFLKDSAGNVIATANLMALTNLPILFAAVDGTISGAPNILPASGVATAIFTGTIPGNGSGSATFDGVTSAAAIAVEAGVSSVASSPVSFSYMAGQTVAMTITFNSVVTVTGSPRLALSDGGTAIYSSGTGSSNLVFNYVVGAGDTSAHLDYASTSALTLNGGTITAGSVPVLLPLASPGAVGSLGAITTLIIDTTLPVVTFTNSPPPITAATAATFGVSITETGSGLATQQYQLDGGALTAFTSPVTITGLATGAHSIVFKATDKAGNFGAANYSWTIGAAPSISAPPASQSVTYGSNATLTVTAAGTTPLVYQWYFNNSAVGGAVASNFNITSMTLAKAGNYKVVVTNSFGSITSSVAIITLSPATPVTGILSSKNPAGYRDSITFSATLPGDATGSVIFSAPTGPFSTNAVASGTVGSLALASLPRGTNLIAASYSGDGNYLGSTNSLLQIVTNHPPIASDLTSVYVAGGPFYLNIAGLLAGQVTDLDGDPVTLISVSVSTNGITPTTNATTISFLNPNHVNDQFTYTVTDGHGGSATGKVFLQFSSAGLFGSNATAISRQGGVVRITFSGFPGYAYTVQRSTNGVTGPYLGLMSTNAPAGGLFLFTDSPTPFLTAIYRLSYP